MSALVRSVLNRYLRGYNKAGRSWQALVGYTPEQLLARLNETMPAGYSWEDFGRAVLHIDHIRPVSLFQFSSVNDLEFKQCWALTNLQLLPAFDNLSKGTKYAAA